MTAPTLGKVQEKRLSIDMCSFRQDIWTNGDEELDPVTRHFLIQMKYAPYRKVVRKVGKATKKETKSFVWKSFVKRCLQGFAKIHLDVLRPWRQSVGKSVSHHHGMLAFMHTFGALRKLKQKPRKVGEDHSP